MSEDDWPAGEHPGLADYHTASARQMPLTSTISDYNPLWPRQYADEVERCMPVFGDTLISLYHIGSTAVPGLSAKPEIDILAVVRGEDVANQLCDGLYQLGYRRGADLSAGHQFFKRDVDDIRTHKLHLCTAGHTAVTGMLGFRELLRTDEVVRQEYQSLKLKLEGTNTAGIGEYLRMKAPFIENALKRNTT